MKQYGVDNVAKKFSQSGLRRLGIRVVAAWLCACFIVMSVPSNAQAWMFSVKDEIELGKKFSKEVERKYKVCKEQLLQDRVERLGRPLAKLSGRDDLPFTFKVIESKEINAFALPGGPVYVFRGLAEYMNDDELAGVLGHEIGHIVKRHSVKQLEKSISTGVIMLLAAGSKGVPLQIITQQMIMAGYSRDDEREADYLGFKLALQSGGNPYGMRLGIMKLSKVNDAPDYGLFSSHPEPDARIALLDGYAKKEGINPSVILVNQTWQINDGTWNFDTVSQEDAYGLAGTLYRVAHRGGLTIKPEWFILDKKSEAIDVYYDDILIWSVSDTEAAIANVSAEEMAERYLNIFRDWAVKRNLKETVQ